MIMKKTNSGSNTLYFAGIIIAIIVVVTAMFLGVRMFVIQPMRYSDAIELFDSGEYNAAIIAFENLGDYRNSAVKANERKYFLAKSIIACFLLKLCSIESRNSVRFDNSSDNSIMAFSIVE